MLVLSILCLVIATVAHALTRSNDSRQRHDGTLYHTLTNSSYLKVDPVTGAVVFHREAFERQKAAKRQYCFRKLYYNYKNYSLSFVREYRVASGGKLWDSYAVDHDSTIFFYVDLCYDDFFTSEFDSITFDKGTKDASHNAILIDANVELGVTELGTVNAETLLKGKAPV